MFTLEGFDLVERIGAGGMASVWKARQCSLDREVAIKVLSPHFCGTAEDVARFQSEARTAGRLKHPGIVQVYDAVFQNGVYCFVMELVDGYTVGEWMRRKGRLAEREAIDIADCVADALDYAWKNYGMVHCDIKPDNVMVDADGTVKLTDLGLSRTVTALRSAEDASEEVFGTPAYISPEQAMGEHDLDCRADMYSLGAMLYHMVTGQMLFQGEDNDKVMESQVAAHVPAIRTIVPEITIPFENFVEKLLAKDRRYRHSDWKQVRADLTAVRYRHPLPCGFPHPGASTMLPDPNRAVQPSTPLERLRNTPTTSRTQVLAFVLVLLLVLAGIAGLLLRHARSVSTQGNTTPSAIRAPAVSRAAQLLAEARCWSERHVNRNEEIIARYGRVVEAYPQSPEAGIARAEIARIRQRIADKCAELLETLEYRTVPMVSAGDFAAAIGEYENYNGPYAAETRAQRLQHARLLRQQQREHAKQAAAEAARREAEERRAERERRKLAEESRILEDLMTVLSTRGIGAAKSRADELAVEFPDAMTSDRMQPYREILTSAQTAERAVLQSFFEKMGQTVEVRTRSGSFSGRVNHVGWNNGDILLTRLSGTSQLQVRINVSDLTLPDRLQRMGSGDTPGIRLARALLCIEQGAYDYAREQAMPLPELLKDRVMALIPAGR